MSIIEHSGIDNWPEHLRWSYNGTSYKSLSGVKLPADLTGTVTFRFRPTVLQRIAILFGRDVYVSAMTFSKPLQPLRIDCGEPDFITEQRPINNAIGEATT